MVRQAAIYIWVKVHQRPLAPSRGADVVGRWCGGKENLGERRASIWKKMRSRESVVLAAAAAAVYANGSLPAFMERRYTSYNTRLYFQRRG